jgi:hypothetical protein
MKPQRPGKKSRKSTSSKQQRLCSRHSMKASSAKKQVDIKAVPSRRPSILARQNDDGSTTILNLGRDNSVYFLDGISSEIYMNVNGRSSWEKIRDSVAKRNSVSAKQIDPHLRTFILWLHKERLITDP